MSRTQKLMQWGGVRAAKFDRRPVPHRAIVRAAQELIPRRFDPASAGDLEATFELRIRDPGGGEADRFALVISGGVCVVEPGPAVSPGATATIGADDLILLVSGAVGWPQLMSSGRLQLAGDPFLGLRFPSLFALPVAAA